MGNKESTTYNEKPEITIKTKKTSKRVSASDEEENIFLVDHPCYEPYRWRIQDQIPFSPCHYNDSNNEVREKDFL